MDKWIRSNTILVIHTTIIIIICHTTARWTSGISHGHSSTNLFSACHTSPQCFSFLSHRYEKPSFEMDDTLETNKESPQQHLGQVGPYAVFRGSEESHLCPDNWKWALEQNEKGCAIVSKKYISTALHFLLVSIAIVLSVLWFNSETAEHQRHLPCKCIVYTPMYDEWRHTWSLIYMATFGTRYLVYILFLACFAFFCVSVETLVTL